ncbi:hypothetical protein [Streptomyces sp. NPDC004728]|uniref:hypothetical protein n=1 Tax=Streptomyces sp. NPDC004728 TaxID=3154289 RepID=UPI0033A29EAC
MLHDRGELRRFTTAPAPTITPQQPYRPPAQAHHHDPGTIGNAETGVRPTAA